MNSSIKVPYFKSAITRWWRYDRKWPRIRNFQRSPVLHIRSRFLLSVSAPFLQFSAYRNAGKIPVYGSGWEVWACEWYLKNIMGPWRRYFYSMWKFLGKNFNQVLFAVFCKVRKVFITELFKVIYNFECGQRICTSKSRYLRKMLPLHYWIVWRTFSRLLHDSPSMPSICCFCSVSFVCLLYSMRSFVVSVLILMHLCMLLTTAISTIQEWANY